MKRIAFIDDDEAFEIPLFRDVFGSAFDVLAAPSLERFNELLASTGGPPPDLFVLDMYFPSGPADGEAVSRLRAHPLNLPDDGAEMRRAHANLLEARRRLGDVLHAWRQGMDGGLMLARAVRRSFPRVPIVFYTRKASAEDVLRSMSEEGVVDVIRKPSGRTDEETKRATFDRKNEISSRFFGIMAESPQGPRSPVNDAARTILTGVTFFAEPEG